MFHYFSHKVSQSLIRLKSLKAH
uniref:Uncharacterized protein n=1 Tax=Rhizophora mucronata TaxID=61149 RepID=A0A2P2PFN7_RHIMU